MAIVDVSNLIRWSEWQPLHGSSRNPAVPGTPGLYRVRVASGGEVVYVGQTGGELRQRLAMLCTCYATEMPYRAPHTAAPTLWSLRHRDGIDFEASTAVIDTSKVERLALEAVAITVHRAEHGRSPLANFGGRIAGYRLSSSNDSALVRAGKRFRGGIDPLAEASIGAAVPGSLDGDVTSIDWLGLPWSPWHPVTGAASATGTGVYRLRRAGADELLYVGQGRIGHRVRSHLAKTNIAGHRQAEHFNGDLECSWVELDVPTRVLLEYENDAIASHRLVRGEAPRAQFVG